MGQRYCKFCFVLICFLTSLASVQAADIRLTPELATRLAPLKPIFGPPLPSDYVSSSSLEGAGTGQAIITIDGIIEKGDAAKLENMLTSGEPYYKALVFNSIGGSFLEGIRIGEMLQNNLSSQDPSLAGVYVLKGQQCLSACALAFSMASIPKTPNGDYGPDTRYVEYGAKLGFHMGVLPENLLAQKAQVQEIMNLTYDVVAAYTKLIKGNLNPEILLEEALKHRTADSFFYLSGGVRTYNMGFTPVTASILAEPAYDYAMSLANISDICQSFIVAAPIRKTLVTYGYMYVGDFIGLDQNAPISDLFKQLNSDNFALTTDTGEMCYVSRYKDRQLLIEARESGHRANCISSNANDTRLPTWCATSYQAKSRLTVGMLSDVYKCVDNQLVTQFIYWGNDADVSSDVSSAPAQDSNGWKRTISREVNARSEPSLDGAIKTKLQQGSEVQVIGCRITGGSQGVWYQVNSRSGPAWISARFVREIPIFMRPFQ